MKLMTDCIPCNLKAALTAIRELTTEEDAMKRLLGEIMQVPAMRGKDWNITGSQLVEQIFTRITGACGETDPFRKRKALQNKKCLELYPRLKKLLSESDDPLYVAVNLAIVGNSIDPMGYLSPQDIEQAMRASLDDPVPRGEFMEFKDRLEKSSQLIYLGDNCGEIVLDKLLIETIKTRYHVDVTFVVRSVPALNDATLKEAELVGMPETATVVENGIDGPLPGTILSRCSEQLRSLWNAADLIISKGGGNFDSLDEEKGITTPLYYMLVCKCSPYESYFNVPMNRPILRKADCKTSDR
ncbi:MAG: ARMT1-like domain-containing protein [Desulfomonile sp.]|nr:ARMT1-like domain-containing protein [Desulfomonile sp.]